MTVKTLFGRVEEQVLAIQDVILIIICDGQIPPVIEPEFIGEREVRLLLHVLVVRGQKTHIVVFIMGEIVRVFEEETRTPPPEPFILPLALDEGVPIPEALAVPPDIIDNRPRHTSLRVVVIGMKTPKSRCAVIMMQAQFRTNGIHISVLADGCGVIRRFAIRQDTPVAERIFAVRIDIFGIEGQGEILF